MLSIKIVINIFLCKEFEGEKFSELLDYNTEEDDNTPLDQTMKHFYNNTFNIPSYISTTHSIADILTVLDPKTINFIYCKIIGPDITSLSIQEASIYICRAQLLTKVKLPNLKNLYIEMVPDSDSMDTLEVSLHLTKLNIVTNVKQLRFTDGTSIIFTPEPESSYYFFNYCQFYTS